MSSKYTKKTSRSRRKLHRLKDDAVTVDVGEGRATVQMVLPMEELLSEVAQAVEHMAGEVGLGLIKGLIDEEVRQLAGERYAHDKGCQVHRCGSEEGHVIFAGRKVAMERPRVRGKDGKEVPLQRYRVFQSTGRIQDAVQSRIVRRVSTRDYAGVIDDLCEGYGIEKSSVKGC